MDTVKLLVVVGSCLLLLSGQAAGQRWGRATTAPPEVLASHGRSGFRLLSGRNFRNDGKTNNEKLLPTIKNNNQPPAKSEKTNERRFIPTLSRNDFETSNDLIKEVPKVINFSQLQPNTQKQFSTNVAKVRESSPVLQEDSLLTKSYIEKEKNLNTGSSSPLVAQSSISPSRSGSEQYNQINSGPLFDSKRHLLSEAAVIAKRIKTALKKPDEVAQTQNYNEDDDKYVIEKATMLTKKLKTILNGRIRNSNLLKPSSPSINFNISNFTLNNTTKQDSLPTLYANMINSRPLQWNTSQNSMYQQNPKSGPQVGGGSWSWNVGAGGRTTEPTSTGPAGEREMLPVHRDDWNSRPMQWNTSHNNMFQQNPKSEAQVGGGGSWSWNVGAGGRTTEPTSAGPEGEREKLLEPRDDWNSRPKQWNTSHNNMFQQNLKSEAQVGGGGSWSWNVGAGGRTTEPTRTGPEGEREKLPEPRNDWNSRPIQWNTSHNNMFQQNPKSEAQVGGGGSWSWNVGAGGRTTEPTRTGPEGEREKLPEPRDDWNPRPKQWNTSHNNMFQQNPKSEAQVGGGGSWSWNVGAGGRTTEPTRTGPEGEREKLPEPRNDWNSRPIQWNTSHNNMFRQNPKSEAPVEGGGSWSWNVGAGGHTTEPTRREPEGEREKLPEPRDDWNSRHIQWNASHNNMSRQNPKSEGPGEGGGSWSWNVGAGGRTTEPTSTGPEVEKGKLPDQRNEWNFSPEQWNTSQNSMVQQKPRSDSWSGNFGPEGRPPEPIYTRLEGEKGKLPEKRNEWNLRPEQWNTSQNSMDQQKPRSEAQDGGGGSWSWNVGQGGRTTEPIHTGSEGITGKLPERKEDWNSRPEQWNSSQNSMDQQKPRPEAQDGGGGSWSWNVGQGGRTTEPIHTGSEGIRGKLPERKEDWNSRPMQWNTSKNSMDQQSPVRPDVRQEGRTTELIHTRPEGEREMLLERRYDGNLQPTQWDTSPFNMEQLKPREASVEGGVSGNLNVMPKGHITELNHNKPGGESEKLHEPLNDWNTGPTNENTPQNNINPHKKITQGPVGGSESWNLNGWPEWDRSAPNIKAPDEERGNSHKPIPGDDINMSLDRLDTSENKIDPNKPKPEIPVEGGGTWNLNQRADERTTEPNHKEPEVERGLLPIPGDHRNMSSNSWDTSENIIDQSKPRSEIPGEGEGTWNSNVGRTGEPNHKDSERETETLTTSITGDDTNMRPKILNTSENNIDPSKPRSEIPVEGGGTWNLNLRADERTTEPNHKEPEVERGLLPIPGSDRNMPPNRWDMSENIIDQSKPRSEAPVESERTWNLNVRPEGRTTESNHKESETETEMLPTNTTGGDKNMRPEILNTSENKTDPNKPRSEIPVDRGGTWNLNLRAEEHITEPNHKEPEVERHLLPIHGDDINMSPNSWGTSENIMDQSKPRSEVPFTGGGSGYSNVRPDERATEPNHKKPEVERDLLPIPGDDMNIRPNKWAPSENIIDQSKPRSEIPGEGEGSWNSNVSPQGRTTEPNYKDSERETEMLPTSITGDDKNMRPEILYTSENKIDPSKPKSETPVEGGGTWNLNLRADERTIEPNHKEPEVERGLLPIAGSDRNVRPYSWDTSENIIDQSKPRSEAPGEGEGSWDSYVSPQGRTTEPIHKDSESETEMLPTSITGDDKNMRTEILNTSEYKIDPSKPKSEIPVEGGGTWNFNLRADESTIEPNNKEPEVERGLLPIAGSDRNMPPNRWDTSENKIDPSKPKPKIPVAGGGIWKSNVRPEGRTTETNHKDLERETEMLPTSIAGNDENMRPEIMNTSEYKIDLSKPRTEIPTESDVIPDENYRSGVPDEGGGLWNLNVRPDGHTTEPNHKEKNVDGGILPIPGDIKNLRPDSWFTSNNILEQSKPRSEAPVESEGPWNSNARPEGRTTEPNHVESETETEMLPTNTPGGDKNIRPEILNTPENIIDPSKPRSEIPTESDVISDANYRSGVPDEGGGLWNLNVRPDGHTTEPNHKEKNLDGEILPIPGDIRNLRPDSWYTSNNILEQSKPRSEAPVEGEGPWNSNVRPEGRTTEPNHEESETETEILPTNTPGGDKNSRPEILNTSENKIDPNKPRSEIPIDGGNTWNFNLRADESTIEPNHKESEVERGLLPIPGSDRNMSLDRLDTSENKIDPSKPKPEIPVEGAGIWKSNVRPEGRTTETNHKDSERETEMLPTSIAGNDENMRPEIMNTSEYKIDLSKPRSEIPTESDVIPDENYRSGVPDEGGGLWNLNVRPDGHTTEPNHKEKNVDGGILPIPGDIKNLRPDSWFTSNNILEQSKPRSEAPVESEGPWNSNVRPEGRTTEPNHEESETETEILPTNTPGGDKNSRPEILNTSENKIDPNKPRSEIPIDGGNTWNFNLRADESTIEPNHKESEVERGLLPIPGSDRNMSLDRLDTSENKIDPSKPKPEIPVEGAGIWKSNVRPEGRTTETNHKDSERETEKLPTSIAGNDENMRPEIMNTSEYKIDLSKPRSEIPTESDVIPDENYRSGVPDEGGGLWNLNVRPDGHTTEPNHKEKNVDGGILPIPGDIKNLRPDSWFTSNNILEQSKPRSEAPVESEGPWNSNARPGGRTTEPNHVESETETEMLPTNTPRGDKNIRPEILNTPENIIDPSKPRSEIPTESDVISDANYRSGVPDEGGGLWNLNVRPDGHTTEPNHKEKNLDGEILPIPGDIRNLRPDSWYTSNNILEESKPSSEAPVESEGPWNSNVRPEGRTTEPNHEESETETEMLPTNTPGGDKNIRPEILNTSENKIDPSKPRSEIPIDGGGTWNLNLRADERTTEPNHKEPEVERGLLLIPGDDRNIHHNRWDTSENIMDQSKPRSEAPVVGKDTWNLNVSPQERTTEPNHNESEVDGGLLRIPGDDKNMSPDRWDTFEKNIDQIKPKSEEPVGDGDSWSWEVEPGGRANELIQKGPEVERGMFLEPGDEWNFRPINLNTSQNTIEKNKSSQALEGDVGSWLWNVERDGTTSKPDNKQTEAERGKLSELTDDRKFHPTQWNTTRNNVEQNKDILQSPLVGGGLINFKNGPEERIIESNHKKPQEKARMLTEPSYDWNLRPMNWDTPENYINKNESRPEDEWRSKESNLGEPKGDTENTLKDNWNLRPMQWNTPQNSIDSQIPTSEPQTGDDSLWKWNVGPEGRINETNKKAEEEKGKLSGPRHVWNLLPQGEREKIPEPSNDWNLRPMQNSIEQQKPLSEDPTRDASSWNWNVGPGLTTQPNHRGAEGDVRTFPENINDSNLRPMRWNTTENDLDQQNPRSKPQVGGSGSWSWYVGSEGHTTEPIHTGDDWKLRPIQWNTSQNSMDQQNPKSEVEEGGKLPEPRDNWNSRPMRWNTSQNIMDQQKPRSEVQEGSGGSWSWNFWPGNRTTEPIHTGREGEREKLIEPSGDWNLHPMEWNTPQNSIDQQNPNSEAPTGGSGSWSWSVGPGIRTTQPNYTGPEGEVGTLPDPSSDRNLLPMQWNTTQNSMDQQKPRSEAPEEGVGSWSWIFGSGEHTTEPIPIGSEGERGKSTIPRDDWNLRPIQWNTSQNSMDQQNPKSEVEEGGGASWNWNDGSERRTTQPNDWGPEGEVGTLPDPSSDRNLRLMQWNTPQNNMDQQKPRSEAQVGSGGSWSWNFGSGGRTTEPIPTGSEGERANLPEPRNDWNLRPMQSNTPQNSIDQLNPTSEAPAGGGGSWSWNVGSGGRTTQPNHREPEGEVETLPEPRNDWNLRPIQWNTPQVSMEQQNLRSDTSGGGGSWSWNLEPHGSTAELNYKEAGRDEGSLPESSNDWNLPLWGSPEITVDQFKPKSKAPAGSDGSFSGNIIAGQGKDKELVKDKEKSPESNNDWYLPHWLWNTPKITIDHDNAITPGKVDSSFSWNPGTKGRTEEPNQSEAVTQNKPEWSSTLRSEGPSLTPTYFRQNISHETMSIPSKPDSLSRLWSWFKGLQVSSHPYHNTNQEKLSPKAENINDIDGGVWFDKWISVPKGHLVQAPSTGEVRFRLGGVWVPGADSGVRLTSLTMESPGGSTELTLRQPELDRLLLTDFGRDLHRYFNRTLAGSANRPSGSRPSIGSPN